MSQNRLHLMLAIAAGATLSPLAHGTVIYRETFTSQSTSNQTLTASSVGWHANVGNTGANRDASSGPLTYIAYADSAPSGSTGVNNHPTGNELAAGKGIFISDDRDSSSTPTGPSLFWTSETSIDLASTTLTSISWYQGNAVANDEFHAALKVGANWYVATQGYTQTAAVSGANFASQASLKTFTLAGQTWKSLTLTPGTTLAMGSTTTLPTTGTVTAFGIFVPTHTNTGFSYMRFDTYQIDGVVPEPVSLGLVGVGGCFLLSRRRRA